MFQFSFIFLLFFFGASILGLIAFTTARRIESFLKSFPLNELTFRVYQLEKKVAELQKLIAPSAPPPAAAPVTPGPAPPPPSAQYLATAFRLRSRNPHRRPLVQSHRHHCASLRHFLFPQTRLRQQLDRSRRPCRHRHLPRCPHAALERVASQARLHLLFRRHRGPRRSHARCLCLGGLSILHAFHATNRFRRPR